MAYCASFDANSNECQNCKNSSVDITISIIFQECYAFYDVFKSLEKRLANSGIVKTAPTDNLPTLLQVPYIVNGAFACELALKYILVDNQISFCISSKGHNLEYLFNLLPETEKNELKNSLKNVGNINDSTLQKNIHILADSFNQWRYLFTNIDQRIEYNNFFSMFVNVVCTYILSKAN